MKWVENTTVSEDVLFVVFDDYKAGQDKSRAILLKAGDSIEGVIDKVKDSETYGKIYVLKVEGKDKPVVLTGKTALNTKMGYGNLTVKHTVVAGDYVRITYLGKQKLQGKKPFYDFKVEIAEGD